MWYAWYYNIPGGSLGPRNDWYWLNFRGILGSVATILFYVSMTHLDLGDSVAMTFIAPVIMPILANVWLKESYSALDALATLFAMSGVVFISKPAILFGADDAGGSSSPEGIVIGLVSALLASVGNISIRKVSPNSHTIHIVNYMMLWTLPVCFGMIVYGYNTINFNLTPKALFCFIIVSICSFFGQFLMSRSLLTTPTRFVTPIIFSQVIFAYINQFLFWGVHPTQTSTMGVVLVAISLILLSFKI
ncbi:hypothetical protein CONCODRAFT_43440 [Conidiobolus coronatus NRRL 28638]|uniref:EamA domain-containing protein n=1 Tax=Conidiobolus coronatus (strain ATCC 28846 / CBS 209.66 / NRRL 28638) TaxID=796925 RepID=A0A137NVL0_CONC2|nr:hypothetical protein CONCODRAFT_43440 [Conidiobolus coronatus NRRL 28638]|eukprot:KXN66875.1 hypothetical protein CONCODRAFT_43440 [Conidiobolus coronatus NRRL 28638]